ncbi:CynX/NimT family MFS transporter [Rouxiella sp. WC2420]|uniref:CynX/NimT family MFS transporter n=1 Tax=Rouxiella sp. WC2420 TaxID=3234145 RepID=A0AB39VX27_9GAMM
MTQPQPSFARSSVISSPGFFLFIVLITAANLRTPITAPGPILENIRVTFGLSASAAGLLNFIPLMMFAVVAPVASWLSYRIGLEKSLFGAVCLITLGSILRIALGESGLWLGTTLLSGGIAAANVLLPPLIKRDFKQHTAKYIGLYASTMAITASLASGIAVPLAQVTSLGWHLSVGVWIIPAIVATLVWLPLLKTFPYVHTAQTATSKMLKSPWRSALGWQVSLFMAAQSMVFYTLIDWFTPYAQANGFSQISAGWLLFIYQAISIVANLACMKALKRMKDQRLIGFSASLAIFIGLGGLYLAPHYALLWLIIAGLGAGASMVTCLSLFNLRAADHHQAAQLSGMGQCVGYGIAALGPLIFGMLHQFSGNWTLPLFALLAISLSQMVLSVLAGRAKQIG